MINAWIATQDCQREVEQNAQKHEEKKKRKLDIMCPHPLLSVHIPPSRHIALGGQASNLRSAVDGSFLSVHASP
jgi:hypothetical protein